MLLQIKSAEFRYGGTTIFHDVDLDVNEGDSVGLVGANGAGKSTLLSCIANERQLFSGEIYRKSGMTLGYLHQNCDFHSDNTLFDELMSVFAAQTRLVEEIAAVSQQMSAAVFDSREYRALSDRYHRLMLQADASEAYQSEVKVRTVINGMGMSAFADRVVSTLSGGEKTKAALCKLLLQRPELMILDEPTNHLDYKTLDWLESFLSDKKSTLLVVSHDRYFLDRLCNKIWDLHGGEAVAYNGNYTRYKQLKAERNQNLQRAYDKQQKQIDKLTDYIRRNKVRASTADMAKSREKTLEKMDLVSAPQAEQRPPRFSFAYSSEPSEFPLTLSKLTLGYGDNILLRNADLQVRRGSKVALLGLNGSGKSTLIRHIAAQQPADLGHIIFGKNVRVGYYDQENTNLHADLTVLQQLWFDNSRRSQTEMRNLLAQVNICGDDVNKKVGELSGGERAKLGLAMIMAKDCNFLLLDEPTNHLDLPAREALEEALRSYGGTLLFVSHDRYFVNSVCSEVVELSGDSLTCYEGNYDGFLFRKNAPAQAVEPQVSPAQAKSAYRNARQRAEQVNKARRIREAEERVTQLERQAALLEEQLSGGKFASDYVRLRDISAQLEQVNSQLEQAIAEWERLSSD